MVHKHREILSNRNAIFSLCETSCGAHFKPDVTSLFVGWCIYENFRSLLPRPWRRLTSVSFHLPRCSGVETLPVNEELPKNFWELFMQHFRRKMCSGKNSFERARISTYHSYIRHICAAINFLDLALELGRQSTRSSPESLFAKSFQKTDPDRPPYLLKHERRLAA